MILTWISLTVHTESTAQLKLINPACGTCATATAITATTKTSTQILGMLLIKAMLNAPDTQLVLSTRTGAI